MEQLQLQKELSEMIEKCRSRWISHDYQSITEDPRIIGMMIAKYLEWDGSQILDACFSALEDANFHTEAGQIDKMRKELAHA